VAFSPHILIPFIEAYLRRMVALQVTAADGAEAFYTLSNNDTRSEGIELAREWDKKVARRRYCDTMV
jgi:hypothetical protein